MIRRVNIGRVTEYKKNIHGLNVQDKLLRTCWRKLNRVGVVTDWSIGRPVTASRDIKEEKFVELILSQMVNLAVIIRYGKLRLISTLTNWLLIDLWRDES